MTLGLERDHMPAVTKWKPLANPVSENGFRAFRSIEPRQRSRESTTSAARACGVWIGSISTWR